MSDRGIWLDPASTALLIVDMQNDFCEPEGYYASIGAGIEPVLSIVPRIQRVLDHARALEMLVLYTAITYQPAATRIPSDIPDVHRLLPAQFKRLSPRLVSGTWGAQVTSRLAPKQGELVLEKPGYSAFYQTGLESLLRRRNIDTVILTGVATNGCVLHTAYDAFVRDIDVVVVEDGVMSYWQDLHDAAIAIMRAIHGPMLRAEDAVAALSAPAPAVASAV